jgi:type II secretory pathway component PulK
MVFVLMIVALLLVFYARSITLIEVEQTITEHSRLNKMSENAYQNVTQNAIWLLEADARKKELLKKKEPDFAEFDSLNDMWNTGPETPYTEGLIIVRWRIVDAHSHFPVNTLISADLNVNEDNRTRFENLLSSLNIKDADKLTSSLADWLDPAVADPNAKEDEEGSTPAVVIPPVDPADTNLFEVGAKNGPLLSMSELKMVPGYSKDILQGDAEDQTHSLINALTVAPITKINPNTAPAWVIMAMHKDITANVATSISSSQQNRPFESNEDVQKVAGTIEGVDFNNIFQVKSDFFFLEMQSEYNSYTQKKRVLLRRVGSIVTVEKVENIGLFKWDEELINKMDQAVQNLIESLDN